MKRSVKSTMLTYRNIHKQAWTSPNGKVHNVIMSLYTTGGIHL